VKEILRHAGIKAGDWDKAWIAEGVAYGEGNLSGWHSRAARSITVEAIPGRRGLIQFYVGCSSQAGDQPFANDPRESLFLDHRGEPVYCGAIEVR
jgi:hypothetical protein